MTRRMYQRPKKATRSLLKAGLCKLKENHSFLQNSPPRAPSLPMLRSLSSSLGCLTMSVVLCEWYHFRQPSFDRVLLNLNNSGTLPWIYFLYRAHTVPKTCQVGRHTTPWLEFQREREREREKKLTEKQGETRRADEYCTAVCHHPFPAAAGGTSYLLYPVIKSKSNCLRSAPLK
ncbi:hypothetical protein B0O99DRAFT_375884 [Bisporella sp. PMI_857]|nr:hypothetical protein B0O99DRAFT_375884 [Bisporella sp. PMI_857]